MTGSDAGRKEYQDWLMSVNEKERRLYDTVLSFEQDYFGDMTFQPESVVTRFLQYEIKGDNGQMVKVYPDIPSEIVSIMYSYYRFFIRNLPDGIAGETDHENKSVTVKDEQDAITVLHEMIHVYDRSIRAAAPSFRDILLFSLYTDLKKKIPDLDDRIVRHAHVLRGDEITKQGGLHDILFFLKSLDLDLQLGYQLGTVCGYDRNEIIK